MKKLCHKIDLGRPSCHCPLQTNRKSLIVRSSLITEVNNRWGYIQQPPPQGSLGRPLYLHVKLKTSHCYIVGHVGSGGKLKSWCSHTEAECSLKGLFSPQVGSNDKFWTSIVDSNGSVLPNMFFSVQTAEICLKLIMLPCFSTSSEDAVDILSVWTLKIVFVFAACLVLITELYVESGERGSLGWPEGILYMRTWTKTAH